MRRRTRMGTELAVALVLIVIMTAAQAQDETLVITVEPDVTFATLTPMNLNFTTIEVFYAQLKVKDYSIVMDAYELGVIKLPSSASPVNVSVSYMDSTADVAGDLIIEFEALAPIGSTVYFNLTGQSTQSGYVDGNLVVESSSTTASISWSSWATSHTFSFYIVLTGFMRTALVDMPWVFAFFMVITLMLVGAWWIKTRRGD